MSIIVMILLGIESIMIRKSSALWRQWIWFAVVIGFLFPLRSDCSFFLLNGPIISFFIHSSDNQSNFTQPKKSKNSAESAVPKADDSSASGKVSVSVAGHVSPQVILPPRIPAPLKMNSSNVGKPSNSSQKTTSPIKASLELKETSDGASSATAHWSGLKFALQPVVPYIVLAGFCIMILVQFIQYRRFLAAIRRWSRPVEDPETLILYESIAIDLGIKKEIPLIQSNLFSSPFLFGFIHPMVLLPQSDIPEEELALILRHELLHYKRGHLWIRFFGFLATAVNWYNPFSYLAARTLGYECEQACDELIVRSSGEEQRYIYSETILSVVRKTGKASSNPFGIPMRRNKNNPHAQSEINDDEDFPKIRKSQDYETLFTTGFYKGMNGVKQRLSLILEPSTGKAGGLFCALTVLAIFLSGSIFGVVSAHQEQERFVLDRTVPDQKCILDQSKFSEASKANPTVSSKDPSETSQANTESEITDAAFFTEDNSSDSASSNGGSKSGEKDPSDFRTWKDQSGRFSIVAALTEQTARKIKLKKKNGQTISISISRLSQEDQEYLKKSSENPFAFGEMEEGASKNSGESAQKLDSASPKNSVISSAPIKTETSSSDESNSSNSATETASNAKTSTASVSSPQAAFPLEKADTSTESKKTTSSSNETVAISEKSLESRFPDRLYEITELNKSFVMGDRSAEKSLVFGGRSVKWNYKPKAIPFPGNDNEKRVTVSPFSSSRLANEFTFFEQKIFFASPETRIAYLSFHTGVLDQAHYYLNRIDTENGSDFLYEFPFHSICFGASPNGKRLLAVHQYKPSSGGFDTKRLLSILEIGEKELKPIFEFLPYLSASEKKSGKYRFSSGMEGSFENACWIDEDHILTADRDTVVYWDLKDCRSIWSIRTNFDSTAVSPDRKVFLAASASGVSLYDIRTGDLLGILSGNPQDVRACSFSPDGKRAALLTSNSLSVYDLAYGEPVTEIARNSGLNERPIWTDNNNILAGDILYNIEKRLPLCRYRNLPVKKSTVTLHRGILWMIIGYNGASSKLTGSVLPQKDLLAKLAKIDLKEEFLLSPNAQVRMEFELHGLLDEAKVKEDLIKNLKTRNFTVSEQAKVIVKISVSDTGKKVNVSYGQSNGRIPGFLPPPLFRGTRARELGSIDLKLFSQKAGIEIEGKEIWKFETFTTGPQTVEYDPKKKIEDSVRESNHPLAHFARTVPIPDYIPKSGDAFGALFNADITENLE